MKECAIDSTGWYLQPEPILQSPLAAIAYAKKGHAVPAYSYAGNNPLSNVDLDGRAWWRIATRVAGAGIEAGRTIGRAVAKRLVKNGGDVVADSAKASKGLAKEIAKEEEGAGACHAESHGEGARHYHPVDEGGRHLQGPEGSMGHIFFDSLMSIPAALFDSNGNGVWLDQEDIFNFENPIGDYSDWHPQPETELGYPYGFVQ